MLRANLRAVLFLAFLALGTNWLQTVGAADEPNWPNDLRTKLRDTKISFDKGMDGVPLRDALEVIFKRVGVTALTFDEEAGERLQLVDFPSLPVRIPAMKDVSALAALKLVLRKANCAYRIENDHIVIVPSLSRESGRMREMQEVLAQRVNITKGFHDGTILRDALDFLADQCGVEILVDGARFEADSQFPDVGATNITLPRMLNARLSTVLRRLLDKVGGTYVVHEDFIEVTTRQALAAPDELEPMSNQPPRLVYAVFEEHTLETALQELASQGNVSIVLDRARVAGAGDAKLSAIVKNVSVNNAVQVLADMVELKSVRIGNVLYVTTPDNAQVLLESAERERALRGDR